MVHNPSRRGRKLCPWWLQMVPAVRLQGVYVQIWRRHYVKYCYCDDQTVAWYLLQLTFEQRDEIVSPHSFLSVIKNATKNASDDRDICHNNSDPGLICWKKSCISIHECLLLYWFSAFSYFVMSCIIHHTMIYITTLTCLFTHVHLHNTGPQSHTRPCPQSRESRIQSISRNGRHACAWQKRSWYQKQILTSCSPYHGCVIESYILSIHIPFDLPCCTWQSTCCDLLQPLWNISPWYKANFLKVYHHNLYYQSSPTSLYLFLFVISIQHPSVLSQCVSDPSS